jgi:AcrR family transcriptional regulator
MSTFPPAQNLSLGDHKKRAVQQQVSRVALELFFAQGFDQTTVDEIAGVSGMSRTTFFRYFPTKEDVVLFGNEEVGRLVLAALVERPTTEPIWVALQIALQTASGRLGMPDGGLQFVQMIIATPSIRRRHLEKQRAWQILLVPEIRRRLTPDVDLEPDLRAEALIAAAFACLETAVEAWSASDGHFSLSSLLAQAMGAVGRS